MVDKIHLNKKNFLPDTKLDTKIVSKPAGPDSTVTKDKSFLTHNKISPPWRFRYNLTWNSLIAVQIVTESPT